jgi:hypothetical protein
VIGYVSLGGGAVAPKNPQGKTPQLENKDMKVDHEKVKRFLDKIGSKSDKRLIEKELGYGRHALAYDNDGERMMTEMRLFCPIRGEISQDEAIVSVEDIKFNEDGLITEAWVDGKLMTAKEGLVIELDVNGMPKCVTHEFVGGLTDEPKMTYKREVNFKNYKDRFVGMSEREYEQVPSMFLSDAWCKEYDRVNKIKKGM